jgi:hypothetical protein
MSKDRDHRPPRPALCARGSSCAPDTPLPLPPPDVSLLLRAHSEQHLLSHEVIPVVRQLETLGCLPEEQLPAATAYLELVWAEAAGRAREADAALRQLEELDLAPQLLPARARRYHAAVKHLRDALARRVPPLIAAAGTPIRPLAEELAPSGRPDLRDLLS